MMEGHQNKNKESSHVLCFETWKAFNLNDISGAIKLCNKLIDLIAREKRQPTRREQELINTIKEASRLD